jgi:hypothetical protein
MFEALQNRNRTDAWVDIANFHCSEAYIPNQLVPF